MNESEKLTRFVTAVSKCAVATRSDVNDADFEVYREAFFERQIEDFESAMKSCWKMSRFPTVGQVKQNWPRVKTVDEIQTAKNLEFRPEPIETREDIEAAVDAITDEELLKIFGAQLGVNQFRKHPNGMCRHAVRDYVRQRQSCPV